MINVGELYDIVSRQANTEQTGLLLSSFNGMLKLVELDLLDFITGRIQKPTGAPPEKYTTQKVKDYGRIFIKSQDGNFSRSIQVPADYHHLEALRVRTAECGKSGMVGIDVLNSDKIAERLDSDIAGIKPTLQEPIGEFIGDVSSQRLVDRIVLHPITSGQYEIVYYRLPKYGKYVTTNDRRYNEEVYDSVRSTNLEWSEALLPYFVEMLTQRLNIRNRDTAGFQMNKNL